MIKRKWFITIFFILSYVIILNAQQFNSVPLDNQAYYIIENAVLRGLCTTPSSVKPWSEDVIKKKLYEILEYSDSLLSSKEIDIINDTLSYFDRKEGLELKKGSYYTEKPIGDSSHYSFNAGISWESNFSLNVLSPLAFGTTNMGTIYLSGDIGNHFSYDFNVRGGILYIDRELKEQRTDADGNDILIWDVTPYFPYTFTRPWDAAVFKPKSLRDYDSWPDKLSFGYEIISEINSSFLDNRIQLRFGRMRREWGPIPNSSLYLNANARPFIAGEGTFKPTSWLNFSFLTGVLEYLKVASITGDAEAYQNAFSLAMVELNYKNYVHFNFGSSTVWPKRFELGYLFPLNSNFFYQNNIGDFDNLAIFADIYAQYPGIGKIWFSGFLDEADFTTKPFFSLNRNMYAFQTGITLNIPWIPFASITAKYTKIEPYCYTHPSTETPWNSKEVETEYINNGEALGYYLNPNSDELSIKVESLLLSGTKAFLQYQMIRHGTDFGPNSVEGSSFADNLDYAGSKTSKKYFLKDGAYEWNHIIRIGGSYDLKSFGIPVSVNGQMGVVITNYTINIGNTSYEPISNDVYKPNTRLIFALGFKVFP